MDSREYPSRRERDVTCFLGASVLIYASFLERARACVCVHLARVKFRIERSLGV